MHASVRKIDGKRIRATIRPVLFEQHFHRAATVERLRKVGLPHGRYIINFRARGSHPLVEPSRLGAHG